ncbi:MAG TPA: hypothetical protein VKB62_03575 [Streptosporangiaceae bacterium]|nr:hypothetical protein [Streptosporangiaceae bacterium]
MHNTRQLRCRRGIDNFPEIIARLAGIADRFATVLDCADVSFIADGLLDELPLPCRLGGQSRAGRGAGRDGRRGGTASAPGSPGW